MVISNSVGNFGGCYTSVMVFITGFFYSTDVTSVLLNRGRDGVLTLR